MKKDISGTPSSFVLRVYRKGKRVQRYDTGKYLRFLHHTRLIKWQDASVYVKVNYHKELNREGRMVSMHNDMTCTTPTDLKWAVKTFITEYA